MKKLHIVILIIAAFAFALASCMDDAPVSVGDRDVSEVLRYSSSALLDGNGTNGIQNLYAGQDMLVGEVIVTNDEENIFVKYQLNEDAINQGWCITETHAHVGKELGDFPLAGRWGNPVPGQFDYKKDHEPCVTEYTYEIPWCDEYGCDQEILIAAHAVIEKEVCETLAEAPYPGYKIVDYDQGLRKDQSPVREGRSDPEAVLTYDLGQDESNFFSLGFKFDEYNNPLDEGGWIIVEFDCPIKNGEGNDIMIVEDTWGTYPLEKAKVYVSQDGDEWIYLGDADNTERTVNNIHTESYFDLDDVELEWVKFVKVVDITPIGTMPNDGDGFDLNTIVALHDCVECITYDETAWAFGERFTDRGNWATYFTYTITCVTNGGNGDCQTETAFGGDIRGEGSAWWYYYDAEDGGEQAVYAGQTIDVGTVEVVDGVITIVLADGWQLQDDPEAVKIKGYDEIPDSRPAAGLFTGEGTYKGNELVGIDIGEYAYYVIHLDVENCDSDD